MPPGSIADYNIGEPVAVSEYFATYKAEHCRIAGRYRSLKTPARPTEDRVPAIGPNNLKRIFGAYCDATIGVCIAVESAGVVDAGAASLVAPVEAVHWDADADIESDLPYIIAEWSTAGTLADLIAKGPLPTTRVVEIVTDVLRALQFLHSKGVVHANIKPSNVLLTADGSVRIADTGGNAGQAHVPIRRAAAYYMSPEQVVLTNSVLVAADERSDIFSVGLLIYESLTGRQIPRIVSPNESLSALRPDAGASFEAIVYRATQFDPARRFTTAAEMLDALRGTGIVSAPSAAQVVQPVAAAPTASPTPVESQATPIPQPVQQLARRAGETRTNPRDGAEMVWVPSGVLTMGSDSKADEQPIHDVEIKGFWAYRYPVTQALYRAFMSAVNLPDAPPSVKRPGMYLPGPEHAEKPVAGVSWNDAKEYTRWVGGRLPTEAEWEWIARGEKGTIYPWGDEWKNRCANTRETGTGGELLPVSEQSSGESWCGAVDLLGNATEWCSSLMKPYPYDAADGREDPYAQGSRAKRGGSAVTPQSRVTSTSRSDPSTITGFRVVVDME